MYGGGGDGMVVVLLWCGVFKLCACVCGMVLWYGIVWFSLVVGCGVMWCGVG